MNKTVHQLTVVFLLLVSSLLAAQTPAPSNSELSQAELDQMLAPIALYPDTILSHILIAATYPLEVVQADRWAQENKDLSADEALLAAELKDWDPSVMALVAFPDILNKMSTELKWTSGLGDAFLADEGQVLQRVQDLRAQADKAGNLDSLDHLKVTKEATTIIIESADPEVVYVPYYDTRVVYGTWWWPSYPPLYWAHRGHYRHSHNFYWAPSIYISSGFYFSSIHWHNRYVVSVPYARHRDYRFRSGRQVVRHRDSRRWAHNPRHRRGVDYRHERVRDHYASRRPREQSPAHLQRRTQERLSAAGRDDRRSHAERRHRDVSDSSRGRRDEGKTGGRNAGQERAVRRQSDELRARNTNVRDERDNADRNRNRGTSNAAARSVASSGRTDDQRAVGTSRQLTRQRAQTEAQEAREARPYFRSENNSGSASRSAESRGLNSGRQRENITTQETPTLRRSQERTRTSSRQTRVRDTGSASRRSERTGGSFRSSQQRRARESR